MSLAAILGFCLLSLGSPGLGRLPSHAATAAILQTPQNQGSDSASQPQAPPPQSSEPSQASPSSSGETPNSPDQAKPAPVKPRHRRKTLPSNCSNSPTTLNTTVSKPADPTNSTGAASAAASTDAASIKADSTHAASAASKPCPPPKKVVRNGGSNEPTVQLTGGTAAEQASQKSSTDQLRAATEENLKKAAALQLNPSQKEMVSQIKQFMEQSKAAVAAGDLERGHNLALKAQLLSDELVKP
jgi:hypothetical protein